MYFAFKMKFARRLKSNRSPRQGGEGRQWVDGYESNTKSFYEEYNHLKFSVHSS